MAPQIERWRRTGVINIVLVTVCAGLLLGCLVLSVTRRDASISTATIIAKSDCTHISRLNLFLHLIINLLSSGILASSNFYMQVLSSPSRNEVDHAHAHLRSLDIGIPSVKNIRFISRFKQICWLILLLSSIPLHLLFNSAVFETGFQGRYWNLTIATEGFTQGTPYFAPGASLSPAGSPTPAYVYVLDDHDFISAYIPAGMENKYFDATGYGEAVDLAEYWNESSLPRLQLSDTAKDASRWTRLDPKDCIAQYRSCAARTDYLDVVIVVNSTVSATGWTRSEVFRFDFESNLSSIWDPHIPPEETNSLWFSTRCETTRSPAVEGYEDCHNTCLKVLGLNVTSTRYSISTKQPLDQNWTIQFQPTGINLTYAQVRALGYDNTFNNLDVSYCLARPMSQLCKLGVSNPLILVVLLFILLKITICFVVVRKLSHFSLVTPGDAMESFISKPDPRTEGLCTLGIADSQRLEYGPRKLSTLDSDTELTSIIRPRQWHTQPRRLIRIIPRAAWTRTYCLLLVAVILVMTCLILSLQGISNPLNYPFGHSDQNLTSSLAKTYTGSLIVANSPQLVLSLCYFSYNAFFTRLAVEIEWNSFSLEYKPLRVSYPTGEQDSKYRLQLPYKYSLPLLAISIMLHWFVSNTIYIYIVEGGYWDFTWGVLDAGAQYGVSQDAVIGLGYSPPAILALFTVTVVLMLFPVFWSLRKVRGNMISGGSNSLVISAACHAIVPQGNSTSNRSPKGSKMSAHKTRDKRGAYKMLESPLIAEETMDKEEQALRELARNKIKWGVVALPSQLASHLIVESGQIVKHLTFGGLNDDVKKPEDGHLYA